MEIKIGIQNIAREVSIETDRTGEQVEADLREAMTSHGLFSLTDTKGRKVIVPASASARSCSAMAPEKSARSAGNSTTR